MARGLALTLAALAAALHLAVACSTVTVNPGVDPNSTVSARTMDFSNLDLNTTVDVVPKGSKLWSGLQNIDLTGSKVGDANVKGKLKPLRYSDVFYNAPARVTLCDTQRWRFGSARIFLHCSLKPSFPPIDALFFNPTGQMDFPVSDSKQMYYTNKYGFVALQQHIFANTIQPMAGNKLNITNAFGDALFSAVSDGLNEKVWGYVVATHHHETAGRHFVTTGRADAAVIG